MLGRIARVLYVFRYVNSRLAVCIWQSKIGGWLTEEFLSFMRSIKLVVVQSTWLSLVVSYISFNQVSPCIIVGEAVLQVLFGSCYRKSKVNPGVMAHWSERGLRMHLSALLNRGQPGWHDLAKEPGTPSHFLWKHFHGVRLFFSFHVLFWGVFCFVFF